jgi:hypothetical protein
MDQHPYNQNNVLNGITVKWFSEDFYIHVWDFSQHEGSQQSAILSTEQGRKSAVGPEASYGTIRKWYGPVMRFETQQKISTPIVELSNKWVIN